MAPKACDSWRYRYGERGTTAGVPGILRAYHVALFKEARCLLPS